MRLFIFITTLFLFLNAENRVALLIGNSSYPQKMLNNPTKDVDLLALKLKDIGFKVYKEKNLTKSAMLKALRDFYKKIDKNSVAIIYFSGHGVNSTLDNKNYLIPIGAFSALLNESQLSDLAISDSYMLGTTSGAKFSILLLDACRSNDFAKSRGDKGLGQPSSKLANDFIISYATEVGKTAQDGVGNSPYALALNKYLSSNYSITDMFTKIRNEVSNNTNGKQEPFYISRSKEIFHLAKNQKKLDTLYLKPEKKIVYKDKDIKVEKKIVLVYNKKIKHFFKRLLFYINRNDIRRVMTFFDNRVEYYGKTLSKRDILRDKKNYLKKWDRFDYKLKHIYIRDTNIKNIKKVDVLINFDVSNSSKRIYGKSMSTYKIDINKFKIIYEKSRVISKKKRKY